MLEKIAEITFILIKTIFYIFIIALIELGLWVAVVCTSRFYIRARKGTVK